MVDRPVLLSDAELEAVVGGASGTVVGGTSFGSAAAADADFMQAASALAAELHARVVQDNAAGGQIAAQDFVQQTLQKINEPGFVMPDAMANGFGLGMQAMSPGAAFNGAHGDIGDATGDDNKETGVA